MTRSELIAKLAAKNPALYHRDIERLVSTILDEIGGALERGDRVELRGFGAFSVRHRKSRIGRNPRTGTSVQVSEKGYLFSKWAKVCASAEPLGSPPMQFFWPTAMDHHNGDNDGALAVSFTISNDAMISLSLWPFTQNLEIPIWLFGVGAFVIGGILGAVLMGGQMLAIRAKLWRAQSQIRKLDKQAAQESEKDTNQALHTPDI